MIDQLTVFQLVKVIGIIFVLGALLLLLLSVLPASRAAAGKLWPLLGSEAIILAGGVLPWLLPPMVRLACLTAAAARIGFESGTIHSKVSGRPLSNMCMALLAVAVFVGWFTTTTIFLCILALVAAAALAVIGYRGMQGSATASLGRFALFPLVPLAGFAHAAAQPRLASVLVLSFLLVEVFDSFSLLGGRLYGKTPLVPRLSPRKTWEGLATGIAALFATVLAFVLAFDLPPAPMLLSGITVMICAMAGDLLGSLAKRQAGVKDYPPVMSVQGGLLDIADAWLVAGPFLAGVLVLLGWL